MLIGEKFVKTPMRYPGGKTRAIDSIAQLIPQFDEYREPFFGGGSVYYNVKQMLPNKKYWVNDLFEPLYKFWYETQNNLPVIFEHARAWIHEYVTKYPDKENYLKRGKDLYDFLKANIYEHFDDTQVATAWWLLNRCTFGGATLSGGYVEAAFERYILNSDPRMYERMEAGVPVLAGTKITNVDYSVLTNAPGENVFIFLDPPYCLPGFSTNDLYGKDGSMHRNFSHIKFAEDMKACKHKWLITYNDCPEVREMFSWANIKEFTFTYGMKNVSKQNNVKYKDKELDLTGREIFISNYEINKNYNFFEV